MDSLPVTEETLAAAREYNATRQPGDGIMTDSGLLVGPGDLPEIIDEPDYEKSLRRSAEIFGGDPEDYRQCGMTQEAWEAIGDAPVTPPPGFGVMRGDDFFASFIQPLPACCSEAVSKATESIAVYAGELVEKARTALDEAAQAARKGDTTQCHDLLAVHRAYMKMAQDVG